MFTLLIKMLIQNLVPNNHILLAIEK